MKILVTGGGTGGHVGPALAVVQYLQQRRPDLVFRYVGSEHGVEAELAREAGLEFVGVASGKLRRSSHGLRGMLTRANLTDALRVPVGVVQALSAVRQFRPDVVFATGGYVSVPPVLAAAFLRIPILTHEQTVTVGLANKINGRFARRIALTFEGAREELPPSLRSRAFVTGNPVRAAIFDGDRTRAVTRFGFAPEDEGLPAVYVTGGAQGSQRINAAIQESLPRLLEQARVLHQCGKRDLEALSAHRATLPAEQQRRWVVRAFVGVGELGDAYALADVLVCRAGAGTVTEACALGKPAVFIPLVPASGDEQTRNARRSVEAGAARLLPQSECRADSLLAVLTPLLADPDERARLAHNARTLATPRATEDLADALLALA